MKRYLIPLLMLGLTGCANKELVQEAKDYHRGQFELEQVYSGSILGQATEMTCKETEAKHDDLIIRCFHGNGAVVGTFEWSVSLDFSNDEQPHYNYYIFPRTSKSAKPNKIVTYNNLDFFKSFMSTYNDDLQRNLKALQADRDKILKLISYDSIDVMINANKDMISPKYYDKERMKISVDKYQSKYGYKGYTFSGFKREMLSMADLPVSAKFCNEDDLSLNFCSISETPFYEDNVMSDKNVEFTSFYKYGGTNKFNYVVVIENKTGSYIDLKNLDVLYNGTFYPVDLSDVSLVPRSKKELVLNLPRGVHPYVSAKTPNGTVDYGFVSRYFVDGKENTFNKEQLFSPFQLIK